MGFDFDELYPGRFLKSGEFKGLDVILTIAKVELEKLEGEKGARMRGILSFRESEKQLVLNRTNGECLKAMFGRATDAWLGKRVVLWPAPFTDPFTGEVGTAIRVRGSPDIAADVSFELRLSKRKPSQVHLKRIGPGVKPAPAAKVKAPAKAIENLSDAELAAELSGLRAWLATAKPGNPHIGKTREKVGALEREVALRERGGVVEDEPPPGMALPSPNGMVPGLADAGEDSPF